MRTTIVVASLLALLAPAVGPSQERPIPGQSSEPRSTACSSATALQTTVAAVAQHPTEFIAKCVRINAVTKGSSIYENVDGVYLAPRVFLDPSSNGLRLGLDNWRKLRITEDGYRRVDVIGRVQDCETVRSMMDASVGENEIVMISGYCHYSNGTYLWVERISAARGPTFVRQLPRAARRGYGDLRPAPTGWRHAEQVEAAARAFLEAIRGGDGASLTQLHYGSDVEYAQSERGSLLDFLLRDKRSPFASIRAGTGAPQMTILVERNEPLADEPTDSNKDVDADDYTSTICFCRHFDCTQRWPIARFDADNLPTRPYACTHYGPYVVFRRGAEPRFDTPRARDGLSEPK